MKLSGTLAEKGLHAFDSESRLHNGVVMPRVWIVVADREKALIYRKTAEGIERIANAKTGHNSDGADTGGAVHHGYDTQARKHGRDHGFIRKLAGWIDAAEKSGAFEHIILVASPRTLGDIRSLLGKNVESRIKAEIAKDLANFPDREIELNLAREV